MLPGDLASAILQNSATPETLAKLRLDLGLDRPAIVRFVEWLFGALRGDFGQSLANGRDVLEEIAPRFGNTMFLAAYAAVVAVPLAVGLGLAGGDPAGRRLRSARQCRDLDDDLGAGIFPRLSPDQIRRGRSRLVPSLANVSSDTSFADRLYYAFLPMLTLVLVIVAHMMRMTRASVLGGDGEPLHRDGNSERR